MADIWPHEATPHGGGGTPAAHAVADAWSYATRLSILALLARRHARARFLPDIFAAGRDAVEYSRRRRIRRVAAECDRRETHL